MADDQGKQVPDDLEMHLTLLQAVAPEGTVSRLRRRLRTIQLGRDLVDKQVYGFWMVLHALLTVLFRRFSSSAVKTRTQKGR